MINKCVNAQISTVILERITEYVKKTSENKFLGHKTGSFIDCYAFIMAQLKIPISVTNLRVH